MTLYCIFKHEIEADIFEFSHPRVKEGSSDSSDSGEGNVVPMYCIGPKAEVRQAPTTYLSIREDQSAGIGKDPLPKLREQLPGSIGVTLARLWVACGGQCYQGGTKTDENGTFTRPGDLEKLLAQLEENCL